jgi:hypothetical protein
LQDRGVEQVLEAGLIMAVEIGIFQHPLAISAANVEMVLEGKVFCVSVPVLSVHKTSIAPKF